jgi:hypothetical protein
MVKRQTMGKYARDTLVSTTQSRLEIEQTLKRYGATAFMYAEDDGRVLIGFRAHDRLIRFVLAMPEPSDHAFTHTAVKNSLRTTEGQQQAHQQAVRQRWRALAMIIKAKLEAVDAGVTVFEDEFLSHIVLPDGKTVGDFLRPQIATTYKSGSMPQLLPGFGGRQ